MLDFRYSLTQSIKKFEPVNFHKVSGADVRNEDQDQVLDRINDGNKQTIVLTIQYEEEKGCIDLRDLTILVKRHLKNFIRPESHEPHLVTITKIDGRFGFHLWFDQTGHYIEDVTIGSPADNAGLKVRDRLIKVHTFTILFFNTRTPSQTSNFNRIIASIVISLPVQ